MLKPEVSSETSNETVRPRRKEVAAVWKKKTRANDTYLSVKVVNADGSITWYSAFKNGFKKSEASPDFIAFEDSTRSETTTPATTTDTDDF